MLNKLLKHEWRSFWKIPAITNIFLLLFTLLAILSIRLGMWSTENALLQTLLGLGTFFYIIMLSAIGLVILIYTAIRFYKNLYTDEGYLMHTLPVGKRELIISKLLVSYVWNMITCIVVFCCVFALISSAFIMLDTGIIWDDFMYELKKIIPYFEESSGMPFPLFCITAVVSFIISFFHSILMMYASISIGQIFSKHKVLSSIVAYICIYVITRTISSLIATPFAFMESSHDAAFLSVTLCLSLVESIIGCVIFFFVTEWLMKKKLNLD